MKIENTYQRGDEKDEIVIGEVKVAVGEMAEAEERAGVHDAAEHVVKVVVVVVQHADVRADGGERARA